MIRRAVFALIVGGFSTPWASAQSTPASTPSVYATPQRPPLPDLAEVPPHPPKPAEESATKEQVATVRESTEASARKSITRLTPLPRRTSTFQETNEYARREALMDRGHYANPGGVGRKPEYYTANTPIGQANLHPAPLARFDRGGGPNRAAQVAAFQAGQMRTRNIQNNINAYGRPYGAYGAGFGFGFGLATGGLYGGGLR